MRVKMGERIAANVEDARDHDEPDDGAVLRERGAQVVEEASLLAARLEGRAGREEHAGPLVALLELREVKVCRPLGGVVDADPLAVESAEHHVVGLVPHNDCRQPCGAKLVDAESLDCAVEAVALGRAPDRLGLDAVA